MTTTTLGPGHGLGYTATGPQSLRATASLRCHEFYRQATAGLGDFPYPSHALVRTDRQETPYERFLPFLLAGRAKGRPRSWGEERVVEIGWLVSLVWRDRYEADRWLAEREQEAENACNTAELRFMLEPSQDNARALVTALRTESARQNARADALEAVLS
jgi:hypothetical protein